MIEKIKESAVSVTPIAAIVLLLWLYFSAITLIMGAELNYLLVNRPSKKAGRQQKVKK